MQAGREAGRGGGQEEEEEDDDDDCAEGRLSQETEV